MFLSVETNRQRMHQLSFPKLVSALSTGTRVRWSDRFPLIPVLPHCTYVKDDAWSEIWPAGILVRLARSFVRLSYSARMRLCAESHSDHCRAVVRHAQACSADSPEQVLATSDRSNPCTKHERMDVYTAHIHAWGHVRAFCPNHACDCNVGKGGVDRGESTT